jgi:hypothetical protein
LKGFIKYKSLIKAKLLFRLTELRLKVPNVTQGALNTKTNETDQTVK